MERGQIKAIIEKYRRKSAKEERYNEDKSHYYDSVADVIEDNLEIYIDESYETEEDILEDVREIFDASEATLDMMFNRDDEDFNDEDDGHGSFINRF